MNSFHALPMPVLSGLHDLRKQWDAFLEALQILGSRRRLSGYSQIGFWPGMGYTDHVLADRAWFSVGRGKGSELEPPQESSHSALPFYHESVLLKEVVEYLQPAAGKTFLDVTLGGGGHSEALLQHDAQVVAIDQDPVAIAYATSRLRAHAGRFSALRGNFRDFPEMLAEIGVRKFDGIFADIGVSSRQLDDASRGFSFMHDGPLDLRMDPDAPIKAEDLINTRSEDELIRIFIDYGEEPFARRIAKAIVKARAGKMIRTTLDLAAIIESVSPRTGKRHPATLCFQALRIAVNDELAALEDFLKAAPQWLKPGGRVAVIAFHSLEDRLVKRSFQHHATEFTDRPEWPTPRANADFCLRVLTRKPVEASAEEVQRNPRSRSARLRVAEYLTEP